MYRPLYRNQGRTTVVKTKTTDGPFPSDLNKTIPNGITCNNSWFYMHCIIIP